MPRLDFTFDTNIDNDEPDQFLLDLHGLIYEFSEDDNDAEEDMELLIGKVELALVQRDRIWDAGASLFEAMDCHSSESLECFEAIFDFKSSDWKRSVQNLYKPEILLEPNLLFIKKLQLEEGWRRKNIGTRVVKHLISVFGTGCGLVCCKPFPLEYAGWRGDATVEHEETKPARLKRQSAFREVYAFWLSLGFRKVGRSGFVVFNPELDRDFIEAH